MAKIDAQLKFLSIQAQDFIEELGNTLNKAPIGDS